MVVFIMYYSGLAPARSNMFFSAVIDGKYKKTLFHEQLRRMQHIVLYCNLYLNLNDVLIRLLIKQPPRIDDYYVTPTFYQMIWPLLLII